MDSPYTIALTVEDTMTKGKVLTCPECGYTYEQWRDEEVWCNGMRTPDSIRHKKARSMV